LCFKTHEELNENQLKYGLNFEIKRLKNELMFANNCLNTLNKFKKYLNEIYGKIEDILDENERQVLNGLENEYKDMIQKINVRKR